MEKIKIFKFGGGVLVNPEAVKKAVEIIKKQKPKFIVISAFGKSTNALEKIYLGLKEENLEKVIKAKEEYLSINAPFFQDGLSNVFLKEQKIFIENMTVKIIFSKEDIFHSDTLLQDAVLSLGEKAAVFAFWDFLRKTMSTVQILNDVVKVIPFRGIAPVDKKQTQSGIKKIMKHSKGVTLIVPGFIAVDQSGFDVTLGREGSDYTAGIIANSLRSIRQSVGSVVLWKNVPGIMRDFGTKEESLITKISYNEVKNALKKGGFASGLIHEKTIQAVEEFNIPLFIKNFDAPEENGTSIC